MNSIKIKTFLLVAEYNSFSKTAAEISYTPSAVSHIADALEEEIGVKLFLRTRKGVELTENGKILRENFMRVMEAENELFSVAADLTENQDFSLKIGAFSSVALNILPDVLSGFKSVCPEVKITTLVADDMSGWLECQKADVILVDDMTEYKNWHPIFKEKYIAVVPQCEFENKTEVTVQELYNYPLINLEEEKLNAFVDYSKFKENIVVQSIENDSAIGMVAKKLGVAILPELSIKNMPKGAKSIKLIPEITREIGVAYDKTHKSYACKCFIKYLRQFIKASFIK